MGPEEFKDSISDVEEKEQKEELDESTLVPVPVIVIVMMQELNDAGLKLNWINIMKGHTKGMGIKGKGSKSDDKGR